MRARMALHYAGIKVEVREISLKAKPAHMLAVSPKGTVPVLVLGDGAVIDQSLDIMEWALLQHDPDGWLENKAASLPLIARNDGPFKQALDQYKYASRFPENLPETYREHGEDFLHELEDRLQQQLSLLPHGIGLTDIAIFPFIRQFCMVDEAWFQQAAYSRLKVWLAGLLDSPLFKDIMQKQPLYDGQNQQG